MRAVEARVLELHQRPCGGWAQGETTVEGLIRESAGGLPRMRRVLITCREFLKKNSGKGAGEYGQKSIDLGDGTFIPTRTLPVTTLKALDVREVSPRLEAYRLVEKLEQAYL
jgi:hypothetical protein